MNCSNCGKPLLAGSTICPVCGASNTPSTEQPAVSNQPTSVIQPEVTNSPDANQTLTPPISDQSTQETLVNPQTDLERTQLLEPLTEEQINPTNSEVDASQIDENNFVELDDEDEKVEITENMAPPTLNVEEENLAQGAGDLSNEASVSTYSEEAEENQKQEEKNEQIRQEERVDIAIPSVAAVTEVSMPSDGSAPEIQESKDTVGENTSNATNLEVPTNKKKFKISLAKGSKNVPKTLMIVVSVIFLVIGVLLGKALFSKNYCSTSSTNKSVVSNKKVKYVSDGKNNTTNIGGYTYKIPEAYTYDKREGGVLVYGENDLFRIYIKVVDGLYDDLSGAKNSLRASMQENNINVNSVKELKANDVAFLIFETTVKLNNKMIAFSSAGQDQVYYLEIVDANNGYDYDVLDIAADIIKNAEYEDVTSNMERIDITDISDVAVKSALEYKNLNNR